VSAPEPLIRNISDTALLTAVYRARENERSQALFRDPYARRLAGERGEQIAASLPFSNKHTWSWVTRTYLFDQFITSQVEQDVDMVVNLAAGLDARPYRLSLPVHVKWVEIDLPELLAYKERTLAQEKPRCTVRRIPLDLADERARNAVFKELGEQSRNALVVTEGLLIYLEPDQARELARNLAKASGFQLWLFDIASPGLLKLLQKNMGSPLSAAGAPLKFAPEEGPDFFIPFGWKPVDVRSLLKNAAQLKRLTPWMRLLAKLPEAKRPGNRPWSGVCLMEKV
jgi:methyltransferase (TIGR00027 family)